MRKIFMLIIITSFLCIPKAYSYSWPDISFVVLDEVIDKYVFERTDNVSPTVNRVLLLPIIENYRYKGKRYDIALADPIIVRPGEETLRKMFCSLSVENQRVRRCIVLARGYCPGILQPVVNYSGEYKGKTVWLIELPKLDDEQYKLTYQSIMTELRQSILRIGREKKFEEAIKDNKLISTGELLSPLIRTTEGYSNRIVLWNVKPGTDVPICISEKGIETIKVELYRPGVGP